MPFMSIWDLGRRDVELFDKGSSCLGPEILLSWLASFWIFSRQMWSCSVVGTWLLYTVIKIPLHKDNAEWLFDKMRSMYTIRLLNLFCQNECFLNTEFKKRWIRWKLLNGRQLLLNLISSLTFLRCHNLLRELLSHYRQLSRSYKQCVETLGLSSSNLKYESFLIFFLTWFVIRPVLDAKDGVLVRPRPYFEDPTFCVQSCTNTH